jgi:hypothetical protein
MVGGTEVPRVGRVGRPRRHLLLRSLTLGVVVIAVLSGQLTSTSGHTSLGHRTGGMPMTLTLRPSESSVCATINSNSSLARAYTGFYNSLANDSPNWGGIGPNITTPINQTGYLNATAGSHMVITAWESICESPAYASLYDAWGPTAVVSGSELDQENGHYLFSYGIYFHASCASPADLSNSGCGYETDWTLDLVTGGVVGPTTTNQGPPLGGPPQAPNAGGISPLSSWGFETPVFYALISIAIVGFVVVAALGGVWSRRRGRLPPGSSKSQTSESAAPRVED